MGPRRRESQRGIEHAALGRAERDASQRLPVAVQWRHVSEFAPEPCQLPYMATAAAIQILPASLLLLLLLLLLLGILLGIFRITHFSEHASNPRPAAAGKAWYWARNGSEHPRHAPRGGSRPRRLAALAANARRHAHDARGALQSTAVQIAPDAMRLSRQGTAQLRSSSGCAAGFATFPSGLCTKLRLSEPA